MEPNSSIEVLNTTKILLEKLSKHNVHTTIFNNVHYKGSVLSRSNFNSFLEDFNSLNIEKIANLIDIDKSIDLKTKELQKIEEKSVYLKHIIDGSNEDELSITETFINSLNRQIEELRIERDELSSKVSNLEEDYIVKEQELKTQYEEKEDILKRDYESNIKNLEEKIISRKNESETELKNITEQKQKEIDDIVLETKNKVKLIEQFKDFLEETNNNMKLYSHVIIGVLLILIIAVYFSIPPLLESFGNFDNFTNGLNNNVNNTWTTINYALGLLIVKLPWAICLSVMLTGAYKLLKGILITYEKINQDKRNMSAIYVITGSVAESLNEYGMGLVEVFNKELGLDEPVTIKVTKRDLFRKRQNIRWDQIMNYFEKMNEPKTIVQQEEKNEKDIYKNMTEKLLELLTGRKM